MAKLTPVTLDLETFWSTEHSLSKMNPILYCTHPETEIISVSAKVAEYPTDVLFGEQNVIKGLSKIDWSDKIVIGHNMSEFDAMLLAWRCGVRPAKWACTLAMARPHFATTVGLSLGKLCSHFGIIDTTDKDKTALLQTRGRHLKDFTPAEIEAMRVYNRDDTENCWALFKRLLPMTSQKEMNLIDMTIRMLVEPMFDADIPLLEQALAAEQQRRHDAMVTVAKHAGAYWPGMDEHEAVDAVKATLASGPKFAELLRSLGVEPPMKQSPSNPEKMTYAFAKTDDAFVELQDHENEIVAAAVQVKIGANSTSLERRLSLFIDVAKAMNGKMPIALSYYAAHTGRWGGTFNMNMQNLNRINKKKPKISDALRMSLRAPKGYKVVADDLSGIELRINHFLWKVESSMALYRASPDKADLYRDFATTLYNVTFDEVDSAQRQVGKVSHLGLGFGAGKKTFVKVAWTMGGVRMDLDESGAVVLSWRQRYKEIPEGWKTCIKSLYAVRAGAEQAVDPWGLVNTCADGLRLPSGRTIYYPALRQEYVSRRDADGTERNEQVWMYGTGRHLTYLSGGKVDENIVQALGRDKLADDALEVRRLTGRNPALMVHDELVYVVPEDEAEAFLEIVHTTMRTPPSWWPELVTWSEGDIANAYGEAK